MDIRKPKLKKYFIILFLFIFFFILFGNSTFRLILKERSRKEKLDKEIIKLKARVRTLEREIERLKNDKDYIEQLARTELRLIYPGETIYWFNEKKE